jgi:hypothetical protein
VLWHIMEENTLELLLRPDDDTAKTVCKLFVWPWFRRVWVIKSLPLPLKC